MIGYTSLKRAACVSKQGENQGWTPWVYLFPNIILSKPNWGTLTIL